MTASLSVATDSHRQHPARRSWPAARSLCHSAAMSVDVPVEKGRSVRGPAVLVVSVLVLSTCLTWAFYSMRAVMNVGGACADGGPYVSAQPCPDGAALIAVAVPVMIITAMVGSAVALSINAPNLLIPMWGVLFGSLGWNFLEYSFPGDGIVWGWLVCGVMFELMAAPAIFAMLVGIKNAVLPADTAAPGTGARWWVPAYAALGAIGFLFGAWSFNALS